MKAPLTNRHPNGIFKTMDERLEQLVTEARRHDLQTEERQLAVTQLVDEILRSRKICRSLRGQPLFGVYREIYEQVRQQLLRDVDRSLTQGKPKQMSVREWATDLRHQAFKTILDDARLKALAIEAQRHPPHTELRQYALGELIEAIRLVRRLCYPHRTRFSPQFYNLLYDEAVNKTLLYVCRNINKYDPERGEVMTWVNFRLDKIVLESHGELRELEFRTLPSIRELEEIVQVEEPNSLLDRIREFLEEDADNSFKRTHIRNRPDANFSAIALARFSGKSWVDISEEFKIPLSSLSSFFQRCCEKFRSKFERSL